MSASKLYLFTQRFIALINGYNKFLYKMATEQRLESHRARVQNPNLLLPQLWDPAKVLNLLRSSLLQNGVIVVVGRAGCRNIGN